MLQSYISNAGRLLDIADGAGADVIIGNHTEYNDALARLEQTKARKPGDPNPWVVGKPEVRKYLTVAGMRQVLARNRRGPPLTTSPKFVRRNPARANRGTMGRWTAVVRGGIRNA